MEQASPDSILIEQLPFDCLHPDVQQALHSLTRSDKHIGIACSGGADSVFLLRWILAILPELRTRLRVLHFDHQLRGEASTTDARFVQQICKQYGLICEVGRHPSDRQAPPSIHRDEATLRKERFAFFSSQASRHSLELILTAHHQNDRVESLLMRLSRGSALDGLIAPKPVQHFRNGLHIARPLLHLDKEHIRNCLQHIGQPWREDASNASTRFYRNFVRNELLPRWQQYSGPTLMQQLSTSLHFLEEDANCLDDLCTRTLASVNLQQRQFPIHALQDQGRAILRRCVRRWLQEHPGAADCSHWHVERVLQLQPCERMQLNQAWEVVLRRDGWLELQSTTPCHPFAPLQFALGPGDQLCFPDGNCLKCERIPFTPALYQQILDGIDDPFSQVHLQVGAIKKGFTLQVKFWQDGMRYRPLGSPYNQKLHACFINRKIPKALRRRLPIVCDAHGNVLWAPGLIPAEIARVKPDSNDLLRLTYPWS